MVVKEITAIVMPLELAGFDFSHKSSIVFVSLSNRAAVALNPSRVKYRNKLKTKANSAAQQHV
jgi:hypothetical protein